MKELDQHIQDPTHFPNNPQRETKECYECGRKQTFASEGRTVDGSWAQDRFLSKDYFGRWFCSYRCYAEHSRANPRGLSFDDIKNEKLKMAWEE